MDKLTVVKIGGQVIDDAEKLDSVLKEFIQLEGKKLLVHGGGKKASEVSKRLGITPKLIDGRRITDAQTLEVVTMVYGGLANKTIVAKLQALGLNSLGLTGADGNVIPAQKRINKTIDYGYVGDFSVEDINAPFIENLLKNNITPVFCALTHDGKGSMLNTNADTLAAGISASLVTRYNVSLIYCFEKKGVLLDMEDDNSLIRELNYLHYQQLKDDGIILDGMIPKLDNAFSVVQKGIQVSIKEASNLNSDVGTTLVM
ncbi:acetylglutamate kinase [Fulvivirga sp. M361]|uniref:acetylglutamate kinase n=1 Tax=Fulvivirga sp. M361 TaxID=2594266 RepID=UPI00117B7AAD|nr:acetylglutamate kinase [Fulvivirga sp. M361]TRX62154.1 acetylglutamate kinase [Fulvivirga sp. M361]